MLQYIGIIGFVFIIFIIIHYIAEAIRDAKLYKNNKIKAESLLALDKQIHIEKRKNEQELARQKVMLDSEREDFIQNETRAINNINQIKNSVIQLANEKAFGFPFLAKAYDEYFTLIDYHNEDYLKKKTRPALAEAKRIKEVSQEKRKALFENRVLKYQIEYYEHLFPWLLDYKNTEMDDATIQNIVGCDDDNDENDPGKYWVPKAEWLALDDVDKYQKALDRFWKSRKSPWDIGRLYEQYIGYLYELDGYKVKYHGILEGYEDMGRDLICTKGNDVIITQCKCWKKEKIIHEKHINQLFGTCAKYEMDINESKTLDLFNEYKTQNKVIPHFVTSAKLSDRAKSFSKALGIEYKESIYLPNKPYPCIKCNISRINDEKIFHLPFDQQYDKIVIEPERGEFYAETIAEAIEKGFRRAYRWRKKT